MRLISAPEEYGLTCLEAQNRSRETEGGGNPTRPDGGPQPADVTEQGHNSRGNLHEHVPRV